MEGKEELLKLANKQLDQAAELLKAAGEELLAEEADALAVKVSLAEAALDPPRAKSMAPTRSLGLIATARTPLTSGEGVITQFILEDIRPSEQRSRTAGVAVSGCA